MTCYMSLLENGRYRCLLVGTFFFILVILVRRYYTKLLALEDAVGFRYRKLLALEDAVGC